MMSEKRKMTRRQFLLMAGGAAGVAVLACGGLATVATLAPEIKFVEENYEGNKVQKKILVTYASKCGSTGEVAQAIGQTLAKTGAAVDVKPIGKVNDLSGYQGVVLGSAVRAGRWLSEAVTFAKTNQQALSRVPTAYFSVCMTVSQDSEERRRKADGYLEPVRQIVKPVAEASFAGTMDYNKLALVDRLIVTQMVKIPEGDFRNWQAIQTWAQALKI
jgi:menaquinone-dependent protoporphyrinogen oxidase